MVNTWNFLFPASPSYGLGHLVRCRTISQRVRNINARFWVWTDWPKSYVQDLIPDALVHLCPPDFDALVADEDFRNVVVDFPDPPTALLARLSGAGKKVLLGCSDERVNWADVVVNVAEGGNLENRVSQAGESGPIRMDGAGFAILRSEFLGDLHTKPSANAPILVVMGGTDAAGFSEELARLATEVAGRDVRVIIPHLAHPRSEPLAGGHKLVFLPPTDQIYQEMVNASLIITAPGTALLEALALGVPALAVAQNARQIEDFRSYPWLITSFDRAMILQQLQKLCTAAETAKWHSYSKRLATGKSINRLFAYMEDGF